MQNLCIVFFGTPSFVTPVLKELEDNFEVVGVVTASPQKVGRKQVLTPSPVQQATTQKVLTSEVFDPEFIEILRDLKPDLFVVAAYGKILPKAILELPKYGSINIHPSLLPKYRGPSPIQSAILNGDKLSGVAFIKMDARMDHGPIIFSQQIPINLGDNFETLSNNMFQKSAQDLKKVIIGYINGDLTPKPQDDSKASYCKIIKKEDGYFDLTHPPTPEVLDRMIRAYYPWPTAWTIWENQVVKLYPQRVIQLAGKNPTVFEAFLRGHPNFPLKLV